ncbi:MAG: glutamine-hydrolyzing GMP synthase [Candidatus Omnitrophica bacterium]|nr:glutamine-hydrolyzing GMP synthase [Candidatus Omnitrophota bacterium]
MRHETVLILDFGSQYSQLIARRVRESKVFCRIVPYTVSPEEIREIAPKGVILSGGPASVNEPDSPRLDPKVFDAGVPILGICYGMQLLATLTGGSVHASSGREYGRTALRVCNHEDLFDEVEAESVCWMSHADIVDSLPPAFDVLATTSQIPLAAVADRKRRFYGVQFHPEVVHTSQGAQILRNFLYKICGCKADWTADSVIEESVSRIREQVAADHVVLGLSGGVDSSVAAALIAKAIGRRLTCIFVDNGLLRKNERKTVEAAIGEHYDVDLRVVDARKRFIDALRGVEDPEKKRKIIGHQFIEVFEAEAAQIKNAKFLAQGTLYPDVIESVSPKGAPSAVIKSHHNVGGLPEHMKLELLEPLRDLFKDEVRVIGTALGLPDSLVWRHPFPGPGLAVRILGEVTEERLKVLREADVRVLEVLRTSGHERSVWQAFAVLLPVRSVGVMGDARTYENVVAIRAVTSQDGMTADWAQLPHDVLNQMSSRIINEVPGVNRVVYDISSKPPATIEWE